MDQFFMFLMDQFLMFIIDQLLIILKANTLIDEGQAVNPNEFQTLIR